MKVFPPFPNFRVLTVCLLTLMTGGCNYALADAAEMQLPEPVVLPQVDTSPVAVVTVASALPSSWRDGVFMEIFVRAYMDSDGDGIGDIKGLTQKLDYLRALGVTGLWLMPVNPSQDNDHGYAVTNYRDIAPEYGTLADFDELLKQAHQRGIGIVMDYVINHSAAQHPAFVNASGSRDSTYRDWYVWQDVAPLGWQIYGGNPWRSSATGSYFAGFSIQMPDFNLRNSAVVHWHQDNLRFWLNRGVDGFRFDAVGNLVENGSTAWESQPENHIIMAGVQATLASYVNRFMVCEAPAAPQRFAQPDSCGSAFAFGYQYDLINAAKGDSKAIARIANYWRTAPTGMVGFASNHDAFAGLRLYDQLGGNAARLRLAAATYLLQTPRPFIYYGEEIGMAGASGLRGDRQLRTPMSWTNNTASGGFTSGLPFRAMSGNLETANVAAEQADPGSLLNFYRALIALRQSRPSLQRGSYQDALASGTLMTFARALGREKTIVVFNYGSSDGTLSLSGLPVGATLHQLWPVDGADLTVDGSGSVAVRQVGQSFTVLGLDI